VSVYVVPGVGLEAEHTRHGVFVCYIGTTHALIEARIGTPAMLKPPRGGQSRVAAWMSWGAHSRCCGGLLRVAW